VQTTLRINDQIFRTAKAEAAQLGVTLTRYIEDALRERIERRHTINAAKSPEVAQREQMMEALLQATAHFRVGDRPTRDEMHER